MGLFAYTVLGSVKESSIGPTAVMALMTYSYANEGGPAYASLLSFLAGWIELIAGLLNLGTYFVLTSFSYLTRFIGYLSFLLSSVNIISQDFWWNLYQPQLFQDFVPQPR